MWAIGNGESRKSINVDNLYGPTVGCNAIMRDYKVDYLVCVDRRMVQEAIERKINETTLVYTRKDWLQQFDNHKNIRVVPELPYQGAERWDEPFQWGSGPYAVLIASRLDKQGYVNLLGFDLYSKDKKVNNMYKDTFGYDSADKRSVDPRYWIHQIGMVFKCFPKINFTVYQDKGWDLPKAWNYPNVSLDNINRIS